MTIDDSIGRLWRGEAVLAICRMTITDNSIQSNDEFDMEVSRLEAELKAAGKGVLQEPRVQAMRATFRAMPDMDPTRYRPSSEALLRRFLDGGFFRINPLVDMNNLLSAGMRLPLGIYDLGRLPQSPWAYRIGDSGESYQTFAGQSKNAEGKLVLADADGIFGSPVADSGRASISPATTDLAVVAYMPFDVSGPEADTIAREIERRFAGRFHPIESSYQIICPDKS